MESVALCYIDSHELPGPHPTFTQVFADASERSPMQPANLQGPAPSNRLDELRIKSTRQAGTAQQAHAKAGCHRQDSETPCRATVARETRRF